MGFKILTGQRADIDRTVVNWFAECCSSYSNRNITSACSEPHTTRPLILGRYRQQYGIERIFNRLKSRLDISPLFVTRNDQIVGLTNLLTPGVRVFTLIEFFVRRSLKKDNAKLWGLHPENKRKETDKPTTERLLKAFSGITLTIIETGGKTIRHLTPLSELQKEILKRLGLDLSLYLNLGINKSENI